MERENVQQTEKNAIELVSRKAKSSGIQEIIGKAIGISSCPKFSKGIDTQTGPVGVFSSTVTLTSQTDCSEILTNGNKTLPESRETQNISVVDSDNEDFRDTEILIFPRMTTDGTVPENSSSESMITSDLPGETANLLFRVGNPRKVNYNDTTTAVKLNHFENDSIITKIIKFLKWLFRIVDKEKKD